MSEGRRTPDRPIQNPSWLHSDPGVRTLEWLRAHPNVSFQSVLDNTRDEIRERVRRVLEYSSSSESDSPVNVVDKREFTFGEIDESLLRVAGTETRDAVSQPDNDTRPSLSDSTVSNVTGRREFSLTSYDSSLFNPEEIYAMATSRTPVSSKTASRTSDKTAVEKEIERMRQELGATSTEPLPGSSQGTAPGAENAILHTVLEEYHEMRAKMATMSAELNTLKARERESSSRPSYNRPSDRLDTQYSQYDRDEAQEFLTDQSRVNIPSDGRQRIKEARDNVPTFDGSNEDRLKEFLTACEYAYEMIQPTEEVALTRAIICTRLKGGALTEVKNRGVMTHQQLKSTLESCYSRKKCTTRLQKDFNYLRQRPGEEVRVYGNRAEQLTLDFFESVTDGTHYTNAQRETIQDLLKSMASTNFQLGLDNRIRTIVRSRAPATLADAIAIAIEEERVNGHNPRQSF